MELWTVKQQRRSDSTKLLKLLQVLLLIIRLCFLIITHYDIMFAECCSFLWHIKHIIAE